MTVAHHHSDVSGGWLRAGVFGAMDGLVTNIALVAGVGGGGADRHTIILTGMAGLVAGAFSMALGEFASVDTQNDAVAHEVRVERAEITQHPDGERAELADMYTGWAFPGHRGGRGARGARRPGARGQGAHHAGARRRSGRPALAVDGRDQLVRGVLDRGDHPAGLLLARVVVAARGAVVGAVGLFVAGAITSRFTTRSWWLAGLRQLLFGVIAAGATYLVGMAIGVSAVILCRTLVLQPSPTPAPCPCL